MFRYHFNRPARYVGHSGWNTVQLGTPQRILLFCVVAGLWGWLGSANLPADEPRNVVIPSGVSKLHVLNQEWTDEQANWFYGVPQGSKLIPYQWFLHLEQPNSNTPFRDHNHIRSLGYIPRRPGGPENPDGLPIGYTRDGDHLGFTCAACHTNQIHFQGEAWLVDGAPTLADFSEFLRQIESALTQTLDDADKFERFAANVLTDDTPTNRAKLQAELQSVVAFRRGYNERNLPNNDTPAFGPGRIDAFGAILNEVTTTFAQVPGNAQPANAPVSYPFLWDTPQHDRVQWNGAAENNVVPILKPLIGTEHVGRIGPKFGEVLGVFGVVDATEEGSLLHLRGYPSSVNRPNLMAIEEQLGELTAPEWPDEFPAIDAELRDKGELLYMQHCVECHNTISPRSPDRVVIARMSDVGTDPQMARNFATRTAHSGVLLDRRVSLQSFRRLQQVAPVSDLLTHMAQRVVVRRPLTPELFNPILNDATTDFFTEQMAESIGLEGVQAVSQAASAEPSLSADQESEILNAMAEWDPSYKIVADIRSEGKTYSGAYSDLEMIDGKVRTAFSREEVRLEDKEKEYRPDPEGFGEEAAFISPDGSRIPIASLSGVNPEFSASGTRLEFEEAATLQLKYKGRPLDGIWATAPYLHNGSVPNLDELLKPASDRVKTFRVGSREFDPVKVGFTNEGSFEFDTTIEGNLNSGHEYGETVFTEEERRQLIEYMKSL